MIRLTIYGQCYSMKNSLSWGNGRPRKHPKAVQFERDFAMHVPAGAKQGIGSRTQPLETWIVVYYPSYRQDLDCAIVYDLLAKCGVISNDRHIRRKHETAQLDPENPRIYITVAELRS